MRVAVLLEEKRRRADRKTPAAIIVQKWARRFLTRCRLPEEKYKKVQFVTRGRPDFRSLLIQHRRRRVQASRLPEELYLKDAEEFEDAEPSAKATPSVSGKGASSKLLNSDAPMVKSAGSFSMKTFSGKWKSPVVVYTKRGRRAEVCFPHLKVANEKQVEYMHAVATTIQRAYKNYLTMRFLLEKRQNKKYFALKRIVCWLRTWNWRRKVMRALKVIQPVWREIMREHLGMIKLATMLATLYRGWICRTNYSIMLYNRMLSARRIQRWNRRIICRYLRKRTIAERRTRFDRMNSGLMLYLKSLHYREMDILWSTMKPQTKSKFTNPREVQILFGYYGNMGMVDMNRAGRMMKDCKNLFDKHVDQMFVELQFTKLKSPTEKRIDYNQFLDLMYSLATVKFSGILLKTLEGGSPEKGTMVDRSPSPALMSTGNLANRPGSPGSAGEGTGSGAGASPSASRPGSPELMRARTPPPPEKLITSGLGSGNEQSEQYTLKHFKFARLVGKAAYITKFVDEFLSTLPEYHRACSSLKRNTAHSIATHELTEAAKMLQNQTRRKLGYMKYQRGKEEAARKIAEAKMLKAKIKLQSVARSFLARRRVIRTAQLLYKKYIDPKEKHEYWFNPRTKASLWVKPSLLGVFDCGSPIMLPTTAEEFSCMCAICTVRTADAFCEECNESQCTSCFANVHKSGQRKTHHMIPQTICVQCEYQVGSRYCTTCDDNYCDTCYKYMHRKGRLRLHMFKWTCDVCECCEDRATQWDRCAPDDNYLVKGYCTKCVWKNFGNPKNAAYFAKHKYIDKQVVDFRRKRDEATEKEKVEEAHRVRALHALEMKQERASKNIQRVFRGHRKRRQIADFLKMRREFLTLRQLEMPTRNSTWYIVLAFFGVAPSLKSDTTLERALKLFPGYLHHIIAACIENNWKVACTYIHELDNHALLRQKAIKEKQRKKFIASQKASSGSTNSGGADAASVGGGIGQYFEFKWIEAATLVLKLWKAQSAHSESIKAAEKKKEEHEKLLTTYRNARSSSSVPEEQKKALYEEVIADKELVDEMENAVQMKFVLLRRAQVEYDEFAGPSSFPKLIAAGRKEGVLMPFKVNMTKGSSLALTVWPDPKEVAGGGAATSGDVAGAEVGADDASSLGSVNKAVAALNKKNLQSQNANSEKNKKASDTATVSTMSTQGQGTSNAAAKSSKKTSVLMKGVNEADEEEEPKVAGNGRRNMFFTPAKWKTKLREGDFVRIYGITFVVANKFLLMPDYKSSVLNESATLASAPSLKKGLMQRRKSELSKKVVVPEGQSEASYDGTATDGGGNEEHDANAEEKSDEDSSEEEEDEDDDDDDNSTGSRDEAMGIVRVEDTPDHIRFNRPWVLETVEMMDIYKVVPKAFFEGCAFKIERFLQRQYFVQKVFQINSITLHKVGKANNFVGELFDEDSGMGNWFKSNAKYLYRKSDASLRYSNSLVEMSFDFTFRRKMGRALIRTGRMVASLGKSVYRALMKFKKKKEAVANVSEYEKWAGSANKTTIMVVHKSDPNLGGVHLGEVDVDLNAPMDIMREVIQRRFREVLNKSIGDSFLFFLLMANGKEKTLPRNKEIATYSRDYAPFIMNQKTLVGAATVTLVKEPGVKAKLIPEFIDIAKLDEDSLASDEKAGESTPGGTSTPAGTAKS